MTSTGGCAGAGLAAFREFRPDFEPACDFAWEDGVWDDAFSLKGTWADGCRSDGTWDETDGAESEAAGTWARLCPALAADLSAGRLLRAFEIVV